MENLRVPEPEEKPDFKKTISRIIKIPVIKFPLYFAGFVLLGLIFAYVTFELMSFSRTVEVPDLYGKSIVDANELLNKKGLNLRIEGEDYDSAIAVGYILRQDIPAGSSVKEQRGVRVILSRGPRMQSVPLVMGLSLDKAETALSQKGLKVGRIIRVHSASVEKDKVLSQKPGPDDRLMENITLVASSGPYDMVYYCPEFIGKSQKEVSGLAEKLGVKLKFEGAARGTVKTQRPKPGSLVKVGDTIDLLLEEEQIKSDFSGGRID